MDGTAYKDGVVVDQPQLTRTETSKAYHILINRKDTWETGVHSGFTLTVNPINTQRLDMAVGVGFAPNGEFIELTTPQYNIPLANPALGVVNYVYAFYTETQASPQPHETNGTAPDTESVRSVRVRVLELADWLALPLTDPTYSTDAQDRGMLVGIVVGAGAPLTSTNITMSTAWRTLMYATQATPSLSGVAITAVSDNTPEGSSGALQFSTGPNSLAWQAPGTGAYGAAVLIPTEGYYTLTATDGSTIQVYVTVSLLPAVATIVAVTVTGVYTQTVARMSGTDRHHRSLVGTGLPTRTNPHGLSIDDIAPGFADELTVHQRLMHANGIWWGSFAGALSCSVDTAVAPDRLLITAPAGTDTYWVKGKRLTTLASTVLLFNDALPGTERELFEIYVNDVGTPLRSKRLQWPVGAGITGEHNNFVYVAPSVPAGVYQLRWTPAGMALGGTLELGQGGVFGAPVTVPALPFYGMFKLRFGLVEMWFWVNNYTTMPNWGVWTDNITVNAAVDSWEYMPICQVAWSGSPFGDLGYTGNPAIVPPRLVDVRQFGTLVEDEFRDDTVQEHLEEPLADHCPDGIVIGAIDSRLATGNLAVVAAAGLSVNVLGQARCYVKGKRLLVGGVAALVMPAASDTIVYVDPSGTINTCDATAAAFITTGKQVDELDGENFVLYGAALALVQTDGAGVTHVIDLRRNLSGGNASIAPWSVSGAATGVVGALGEFLSLEGALYYAAASEQSEIRILSDTLIAPITLPQSNITLRGGTLTIGGAALTSAAGLGVIRCNAVGGKFTLADMDVVVFAAAFANSSIIEGYRSNSISILNCHLTTVVGLDAFVRASAAGTALTNGTWTFEGVEVSISLVAVTSLAHVATVGPTIVFNNVRNTFANPTSLIQYSAATTHVLQASNLKNDLAVVPIASVDAGATLSYSSISNCSNISPAVGAGTIAQINYTNCALSIGGVAFTPVGSQINCVGCSAVAAFNLTSVSYVRLAECEGSLLTLDTATYVEVDSCRFTGASTVTSSSYVHVSKTRFASIALATAVTELSFDHCVFSSTIVAPVNCAVDGLRFEACELNATMALNFATPAVLRRRIVVANSTIKASISLRRTMSDGSFTDLQKVAAKFVNNVFVDSMLSLNGVEDVQIDGNTWEAIDLVDDYGVIYVGAAGVAGEAVYRNIKVTRNTFQVATVPAIGAPYTGFGVPIMTVHCLNFVPSSDGQFVFSHNRIELASTIVTGVIGVLIIGYTGYGSQLDQNTLYSTADYDWIVPTQALNGAPPCNKNPLQVAVPTDIRNLALTILVGALPSSILGADQSTNNWAGKIYAPSISLNRASSWYTLISALKIEATAGWQATGFGNAMGAQCIPATGYAAALYLNN